jgi:hypothetical protein
MSKAIMGASFATLCAAADPILADAADFRPEITALDSACEGSGLSSGTWRDVLTSSGWRALPAAPADWDEAYFPDHRLTVVDLPWPMAALGSSQEMRSKSRAHWDGYDSDHRWFFSFDSRLRLFVWQEIQTSPASGTRFLTQRCELSASLSATDYAWANAIMDRVDGRAEAGFNAPPRNSATYRFGSYFLPVSPSGDIDLVSGTYLLLRPEALVDPVADHLLLFLAADTGIAQEVSP